MDTPTLSGDYSFARSVITGLAVGDSLGSTSEFQIPSFVPELCVAKYQGWPFVQAGGGMLGWKCGAPTDDTAMALCVLRSFAQCGARWDYGNVAEQFVQWKVSGVRVR